MSYASFDIAVRPADTSAARRRADPAADFQTVARENLSRAEFLDRVAKDSRRENRRVAVLVPGYNQTHAEAVFRAAQLAAEAPRDFVPVVFSWPSAGDLRGYLTDRDSVSYARGDLAGLLVGLAEQEPTASIGLIGHSMGALLVMEALRELRLRGRSDVIGQLEVGLAAPDIDLDLFQRQAAEIGRLPHPIAVLVSSDDRALAASGRLSGGHVRLGQVSVADPAVQEIALRTGSEIVDISALPATDPLRHSRFIELSRIMSSDSDNLPDRIGNAGAYVLGGAGQILSAPGVILGQ